jgi:hypothetical protein
VRNSCFSYSKESDKFLCFWALPIILFPSKTYDVSETGFCHRLQVEPTYVGPIDWVSLTSLCLYDVQRREKCEGGTGFWERSRHPSAFSAGQAYVTMASMSYALEILIRNVKCCAYDVTKPRPVLRLADLLRTGEVSGSNLAHFSRALRTVGPSEVKRARLCRPSYAA